MHLLYKKVIILGFLLFYMGQQDCFTYKPGRIPLYSLAFNIYWTIITSKGHISLDFIGRRDKEVKESSPNIQLD